MRLVLNRCEIRSWERSDVRSLAGHANNRKIWRNVRDQFPFPYSTSDAEVWIRTARSMRPETAFAIVVDGEAVGAIGIELKDDVYRNSAEIGYWLGETFWGRGITSEALAGFTDWVFAHFELDRLYAHVFEWNPASARVLEKAGYQLEARMRQAVIKDGQTIDVLLYAMLRDHRSRREEAAASGHERR
jgi:RimJ/RimL family protein N-acetyltransferase